MGDVMFTPGPWRWTEVDYGRNWGADYQEVSEGPFDALWSDGAGKAVAVAQDASSYAARFDFKDDADARLIAAAPDMLAALKVARDALGANAARDAVDAAIAKAEGRT